LYKFFSDIGISHRVSCPHTHQQNGTAERKHRHIVETGLTLLSHASVPYRFWSDAFSTACFLINRLPSRVISMQTPLERLLGEIPDYTFLKVFGCACWPHLRPYNKRKLEFRSKKYVFLGYSSLHKGYKCLHVPTNRVYISRDVIFDESVFPFSQMPTNSTLPSSSANPLHPDQFDDAAYTPLLLANHGAGLGRGVRLELLDDDSPPPDRSDEVVQVDHTRLHGDVASHADRTTEEPVTRVHSSGPTETASSPYSSPSRVDDGAADTPSRVHTASPGDASSMTATAPANSGMEHTSLIPPLEQRGVTTRLQKGVRHPKKRTDGTVAWRAIRMAHTVDLLHSEPRNHQEAMTSPHWCTAMETEFSALQSNKTWRLVPPVHRVNME
jgi:histone deacetylase 1/2